MSEPRRLLQLTTISTRQIIWEDTLRQTRYPHLEIPRGYRLVLISKYSLWKNYCTVIRHKSAVRDARYATPTSRFSKRETKAEGRCRCQRLLDQRPFLAAVIHQGPRTRLLVFNRFGLGHFAGTYQVSEPQGFPKRALSVPTWNSQLQGHWNISTLHITIRLRLTFSWTVIVADLPYGILGRGVRTGIQSEPKSVENP